MKSRAVGCWACLAAAWLLQTQAGPLGASLRPEAEPRVAYTLSFVPGADDAFPLRRRPTWELSIRGTGFAPEAGAITLVFDSWGDWRMVDSLYLDIGATEPPVDADLFPGNALVLQQPEGWDGTFEAQFSLHPVRTGSEANQRWGMLPRWSPSYSFGQTRNVFPKVFQDAGEVDARATLELRAPRGVPISTGWTGLGGHRLQLDRDPTDGNGFLAFGGPQQAEERALKSGRLEVLQYGQAAPIAAPVAELVAELAASMGAALGPPSDPLLVYISDVGGGGMGTDFGLVLGFEPGTPAAQVESPYYRHFVAHELFHHWLGSKLQGSEAYTWFHEGFTEYLGLWHLAATGAVTPEWFRARLLELGAEAIEGSAWGSLAFAGAEVNWRDGDGPHETMAYKGGAMLAFLMDVELRAAGRPGVQQMLRDFLESGTTQPTLGDLEAWCRAHELGAFWEEYVAGTTVPALEDWTERAAALDGYFRFTPARRD